MTTTGVQTHDGLSRAQVGPTPPRLKSPAPAFVACTVALTPILVPAGPGNSALADVPMLIAIVLAVVATAATGVRVRVPYAAGVTLLIVGGLVATLISGAPARVVLVLAQDLLLLMWSFAIVSGRGDPQMVVALTKAWCRTVPVVALVGLLSYMVGFGPLSGVTAADASRASYTFGDPNLAANYLVLGLVVMFACRRPVSTPLRRLCYLLVLAAIVLTGSNGGAIGLAVVFTGLAILHAWRREGPTAALLALSLSAAVVVGGVVFVTPHVDLTSVREAAAGSIPLFRDSVGRSNSSVSERSALFKESTRLWFQGSGSGYGPARTKATLLAFQAPYVKEAHNDYVATLLERGPVGVLGLILLWLATGANLRQVLTRRLPAGVREAVPRAWALTVGAPVLAVSGAFYEVLHFRHAWTWLALVALLALSTEGSAARKVAR